MEPLFCLESSDGRGADGGRVHDAGVQHEPYNGHHSGAWTFRLMDMWSLDGQDDLLVHLQESIDEGEFKVKRKYTVEEIHDILTQLKLIKIDGEPVFEVSLENSAVQELKRITISTWGTVAHLEVLVKRYPTDE
jgi:hypothetical protein